MDGLFMVETMLKMIRERRQVVVEAITGSSVQDFAAYRHLRGKYEVWNEMESELRSLLKRMETIDDE